MTARTHAHAQIEAALSSFSFLSFYFVSWLLGDSKGVGEGRLGEGGGEVENAGRE